MVTAVANVQGARPSCRSRPLRNVRQNRAGSPVASWSFGLLLPCPPPPPPPGSTPIPGLARARPLARGQSRKASPAPPSTQPSTASRRTSKLPDLVMPGEKAKTPKKQHQAEFGSPGKYFAEKTIGAVTSGGRARAGKHAKTLAAIEKRYGVPAGVVLAIWGRESGFGAAKMPYDAFEVLGTKAFLSTRKDMFRTEVLAALEIWRTGPGVARADAVLLGRRARPAAIPADLLPRACRRCRRRRPRRHLELDADAAGLDRQLPGRLWLGEGPRLGFRGHACPTDVSCALEGPDQGSAFPIGRRWAYPASTASRSRRRSCGRKAIL